MICAYQYVARKPQKPAPRKGVRQGKAERRAIQQIFKKAVVRWTALKAVCKSKAPRTCPKPKVDLPSIPHRIRQKMNTAFARCRSYQSTRQRQTPESRFPKEAQKRRPLKPLYLDPNAKRAAKTKCSPQSDLPYQRLFEAAAEQSSPLNKQSVGAVVQNDDYGADVLYTEWMEIGDSIILEKPTPALVSPYFPRSSDNMRFAGTPLSTPPLSLSPRTPPNGPFRYHSSPPLARLRDEFRSPDHQIPVLFFDDDSFDEFFVIGDDSDKESLRSQ